MVLSNEVQSVEQRYTELQKWAEHYKRHWRQEQSDSEWWQSQADWFKEQMQHCKEDSLESQRQVKAAQVCFTPVV